MRFTSFSYNKRVLHSDCLWGGIKSITQLWLLKVTSATHTHTLSVNCYDHKSHNNSKDCKAITMEINFTCRASYCCSKMDIFLATGSCLTIFSSASDSFWPHSVHSVCTNEDNGHTNGQQKMPSFQCGSVECQATCMSINLIHHDWENKPFT